MAGELVKWRQLPDLRAMVPGEYAYTLDPGVKANQALLAKACRGTPPSIKTAANMEFDVQDMVYYCFDKIDEANGEARRLPRLVIINPRGDMLSMSGWKAIEDALFPVAALGFSLPFVPSHRFRIKMVACGANGQEYAALEWLGVVDK
jgi:hypothetical protein